MVNLDTSYLGKIGLNSELTPETLKKLDFAKTKNMWGDFV